MQISSSSKALIDRWRDIAWGFTLVPEAQDKNRMGMSNGLAQFRTGLVPWTNSQFVLNRWLKSNVNHRPGVLYVEHGYPYGLERQGALFS
jgi:hypothetical protein